MRNLKLQKEARYHPKHKSTSSYEITINIFFKLYLKVHFDLQIIFKTYIKIIYIDIIYMEIATIYICFMYKSNYLHAKSNS